MIRTSVTSSCPGPTAVVAGVATAKIRVMAAIAIIVEQFRIEALHVKALPPLQVLYPRETG